MLLRLAGLAALVLLGLAATACGTASSLGFKHKPTTTTTAATGRTTKSTQGDDSLEDDPAPPPPGEPLEDPIDVGVGLRHAGCRTAHDPTTTPTPTTASTAAVARPRYALVAAPGAGDADRGC